MPSDAIVEGVSGAIGGCIATVATFPLMTITTRKQTSVSPAKPAKRHPPAAAAAEKGEEGAGKDAEAGAAPAPAALPPPGPSRSVIQELLHVARTSGWRSLFSGLSASLVGTTVSQGVYFYLYSLLRAAAVRRRAAASAAGAAALAAVADARGAEVTVAESLLVAALAGMGNVLLTNPIWMVATRMQAHRRLGGRAAAASPSQPLLDLPAPTPLAVAREVYAEYGIGGFWNGVGASLVMVINPTIQYAFYEWLLAARARVRRQRGGFVAARPSAGEVFVLSAVAKAGATVLTYPLLTVKTRMMSARKADAEMQYASVADAIAQIAAREGVAGYYRGMGTKILQSMLATALLFMAKEKITDATRDALRGREARKGVVVLAAVVQR